MTDPVFTTMPGRMQGTERFKEKRELVVETLVSSYYCRSCRPRLYLRRRQCISRSGSNTQTCEIDPPNDTFAPPPPNDAVVAPHCRSLTFEPSHLHHLHCCQSRMCRHKISHRAPLLFLS
ncbi:hypothetical protein PIB30_070774, partial [Stylosanthes scabra]|nr:hypothetical protein [Stylosanthes scabra]